MMFHVRVGNGILFVLGLETNWIVMDCQGQTIYSWTILVEFPEVVGQIPNIIHTSLMGFQDESGRTHIEVLGKTEHLI